MYNLYLEPLLSFSFSNLGSASANTAFHILKSNKQRMLYIEINMFTIISLHSKVIYENANTHIPNGFLVDLQQEHILLKKLLTFI